MATLVLSMVGSPAFAEPHTFIAVEVTDMAAAESWYGRTFEASQVNTFSRPTYEQRILKGPDVIVELVQRIPARPVTGEGAELMKAGFVVGDLDERVARWTEQGVTFMGRRIHNDVLDLDVVLIADPDGNMIQIFGRD
jgi:hypothetical protein